MGVMYKILKLFEWTDTDSCIVQLLRILPSIRQPPQHLKVAARPRGHPSLHRSFPLPKCRPPSTSSAPTPSWTSWLSLQRPAEAKSSRSSVSFHLFRQRFANKQNGPAIPFPRRRTDSSSGAPLFVFAPAARHGTVPGLFVGPPMCISLFGKLSFSASPDGWMEWMNVEEGRSSAEPEAKITRRNGKSSGIGVGKRWRLTVICHVCPCSVPPPSSHLCFILGVGTTNMTANCSKRCLSSPAPRPPSTFRPPLSSTM